MKKLYALITCAGIATFPVVIQVSFNKEELEEMAEYLNQYKYFPGNAEVREVDEHLIEYHWPTRKVI